MSKKEVNYKRNPLLETNIEQYMCSFMQNSNKGCENDIAIQYMGVQITHGQLNQMIDECAKSLLELKIQPGEIISICMPSTPELVVLLYAINKIGAVSNFVDLTKDTEYLQHCIKNVNSKLIITYDGVLSKISAIAEKTDLEKIVYVSALESLPPMKKYAIEFVGNISGKLPKNRMPCDARFISWREFVSLSKGKEIVLPHIPFVKEQLSFIEYTSGTTGVPKAIKLTNECANLKMIQYSKINLLYNRGDIFLNIIPAFVAFGVIMGIHLPLALGFRDELIAAFDNKKVVKYFKDIRPNHFMLVPASYSYLVNHPKFKTLDLSEARTLGCGGDGLNANQNKIIENKFKEQGCLLAMNNGYGASELGAPFCTCTWEHRKYGSVGLPLPGNEVIVLRSGTQERLKPNEIGEICMICDFTMLGYYGDADATAKVKINMENGKTAIMLGDMGFVDEDGYIFIKGRRTDILFSSIGEIWPVDIESFIMGTGLVTLVAVSDSEEEKVLTAYVIPALKQDSGVSDKIQQAILDSKEYKDLKLKIEIVDTIPLTMTGKIDRRKLKRTPIL